MKKGFLIAGAVLVAFAGCNKDNVEDLYPDTSRGGNCDTSNVTFSAVIKPIIDAKCATAGCHIDATASGISLANYHGVAGVANSGKLLDAINQNGRASAMPKDMPKLDDCTIAKITKWVNDGAPDN